MKHVSKVLLLSGMVLCSQHKCLAKKKAVEISDVEVAPLELGSTEIVDKKLCPPGRWLMESLGRDIYLYKTLIRDRTALEEQPSICENDITKCDPNKVDVYHRCIDNKWVEKKCPCPGQICGKGAMFTECRGTVPKDLQ